MASKQCKLMAVKVRLSIYMPLKKQTHYIYNLIKRWRRNKYLKLLKKQEEKGGG